MGHTKAEQKQALEAAIELLSERINTVPYSKRVIHEEFNTLFPMREALVNLLAELEEDWFFFQD